MLQTTDCCETSPRIVHPVQRATRKRMDIPREESADVAEASLLLPVSSVRKAHLLVIGNDLEFIAQQLGEVFRGPTRQVHFAGTGSVGLAQVCTHPPEVIVLDL